MGSEHGVFRGALVGTGALTRSETGALWGFQQMSLQATDLSLESITLAAVLRTDCRGLALMQRPQEAPQPQGRAAGLGPWRWRR